MAQTFFLLDCHTGQPVCFTLSYPAQSVTQATPELLRMAAHILGAAPGAKDKPLILADKEHYAIFHPGFREVMANSRPLYLFCL